MAMKDRIMTELFSSFWLFAVLGGFILLGLFLAFGVLRTRGRRMHTPATLRGEQPSQRPGGQPPHTPAAR
jgi:hypothetical protein